MKKFTEERRALVTQLKRFDYGKEQINRVLAPVSFAIAVFTLLKVYDVSFTLQQIIGLSASTVIAIYVIGYAWDYLGFVEEEIEYGNERNRFVRAVLKKKWLKKLDGAKIR